MRPTTTDPAKLLPALQAAIACAGAALDGLPIDAAVLIADIDPADAVWAMAHLVAASLHSYGESGARELLRGWGDAALYSMAASTHAAANRDPEPGEPA
jgi:hypothetical protein